MEKNVYGMKWTIILFILLAALVISCGDNAQVSNSENWRLLHYPSGEVQDSIAYTTDSTVENGKWLSFYKNGQLKMERNFKSGKQVGKEIGYLEDGRVLYFIEYHHGQREGYRVVFHPNGRVSEVDTFFADRQIGKTFILDSMGNLIQEGSLKKRNLLNLNQ